MMNVSIIDDTLVASLESSSKNIKSYFNIIKGELKEEKSLRKSAIAVIKISRAELKKRIEAAQWSEKGRRAMTSEIDKLLSSKLKIIEELAGLAEGIFEEKREAHVVAMHKTCYASVLARTIAINSSREQLNQLAQNYKENEISFEGIAATLECTAQALDSRLQDISVGVDEAQNAALKELKIAAADSAFARREEERKLQNYIKS